MVPWIGLCDEGVRLVRGRLIRQGDSEPCREVWGGVDLPHGTRDVVPTPNLLQRSVVGDVPQLVQLVDGVPGEPPGDTDGDCSSSDAVRGHGKLTGAVAGE